MTSTPDGAYELRLEEMQSKTAPWRRKTQLSYKSQAMCFSQEHIFDVKARKW